jgi:hypothetical protein
MSTRPFVCLEGAIIRTHTVASAKTVDQYYPVKRSGADGAVEKIAAVGDDGIGIALDAGVAGDKVRVVYPGCCVTRCKVGTGAATEGAPAKYASDGLTDATVGGGTTKLVVYGKFTETGVAGDIVGLDLGAFSFTVGS